MKKAIIIGATSGIGKELSERFVANNYKVGITGRRKELLLELKDKNPERLYKKLCTLRGMHVDRCMLYVFRCAVYFASTIVTSFI